MADDPFKKIKIVFWRGLGWFLLVLFAISSIASFLDGELLIGLLFLFIARIGYSLTRYKTK
jgi:hypothetical protein